MTWLGLDIGGANLKAADGSGWARSVPFPLWREPQKLASALGELIAAAPATHRFAITMTGELCDSFPTKTDGVRHILAAAQEAAAGRDVCMYLVDGRLVTVPEALAAPRLAAASNWHALARFACRFLKGNMGLLIDIGSTTTDIVPLVHGKPQALGDNDTDRLVAGELVYTGVGRTPICAITRWLPWRGARCPVAAELFATAADVYVTLRAIPEEPTDLSTADGRPRTKEFARQRLARMICADSSTFSPDDAHQAAMAVQQAQVARLSEALRQVAATMPERPEELILSGAGEFLAARVATGVFPSANVVSVAERLGPRASQCAPAHAVAVLAGEAF